MSKTEPLLRAAVANLAADPDAQAAYLRGLGTWPSLDELALELDDVAEAAVVGAPTPLRESVDRLSRRLDEMSGEANAHLWQPSALYAPEWADVRSLAQRALAVMGQSP